MNIKAAIFLTYLLCISTAFSRPDILDYMLPSDLDDEQLIYSIVYGDEEYNDANDLLTIKIWRGYRMINDSTFQILVYPADGELAEMQNFTIDSRGVRKKEIIKYHDEWIDTIQVEGNYYLKFDKPDIENINKFHYGESLEKYFSNINRLSYRIVNDTIINCISDNFMIVSNHATMTMFNGTSAADMIIGNKQGTRDFTENHIYRKDKGLFGIEIGVGMNMMGTYVDEVGDISLISKALAKRDSMMQAISPVSDLRIRNRRTEEAKNTGVIDSSLVGTWKGSEENKQREGLTKSWLVNRSNDGKINIQLISVEEGVEREWEETGEWWIKDGKYYEYHDSSSRVDIYEYHVLDTKRIKFVSTRPVAYSDKETYEFIDIKVE